jgi:hypothetical protein
MWMLPGLVYYFLWTLTSLVECLSKNPSEDFDGSLSQCVGGQVMGLGPWIWSLVLRLFGFFVSLW